MLLAQRIIFVLKQCIYKENAMSGTFMISNAIVPALCDELRHYWQVSAKY